MDISDAELRERLLAFGYVAPPITGTSKAILIKKLKSLEEGIPFAPANTSAASDDETADSAADGPSLRQRPTTTFEFRPENAGTYSKCSARSADFWDRIGVLGTALLLLLATGAFFLLFKWIGDWSDHRYRSVNLADGVFPRCSQGGTARVTCVPDAELGFVESNLNVLRAALHHATLTQRCSGQRGGVGAGAAGDFVGLYPLFRDAHVLSLLAEELGFGPAEGETLLRNAKVLFKANPRLEVKVLEDGLLYRNQRLLRSCGFAAWNTVAYTYALYLLTGFAVVWFFYKCNRWVSKLRTEGVDQRRRLVRDIVDVLRQLEAKTGQRFAPVEDVRGWLDEAASLSDRLWAEVESQLRERRHESGLGVEQKLVRGQEREVFSLEN